MSVKDNAISLPIVGLTANEEGQPPKLSWAEMAKNVPHQSQQVLISWIFMVASITLFFDFAALQKLTAILTGPDYDKKGDDTTFWGGVSNWFGVVSCVLWFWGFVILCHWLARLPGGGAPKASQFAAWMKLLAAIFFNMQPATGTMGTRLGAGDHWSNLTGICFFHAGNLISCFDFYINPPYGSDSKKGPFFHGNLPITAMWTYQLATWMLVPANLITCDWSGLGGVDSTQWVATGEWIVIALQYGGSLGLLLGSIIFCFWCDGFRTVAL